MRRAKSYQHHRAKFAMTPSLAKGEPAFGDDAYSRLSTVFDPDTARALRH